MKTAVTFCLGFFAGAFSLSAYMQYVINEDKEASKKEREKENTYSNWKQKQGQ